MIPEVQRFLGIFGETEINRASKKLPAVIYPARRQKLLRSNDAQFLAQLRAEKVLSAVSARYGKITGIVERSVRPQRNQRRVFVVRMRRQIENSPEDIELFEAKLDLTRIHRIRKQRRRCRQTKTSVQHRNIALATMKYWRARRSSLSSKSGTTGRSSLQADVRASQQFPGLRGGTSFAWRAVAPRRWSSHFFAFLERISISLRPDASRSVGIYLLMSCFACSRSINGCRAVFCASEVAMDCAFFISSAAPGKSPVDDFSRDWARWP